MNSQLQNDKSNLKKVVTTIEKDKPIRSLVDSTSPAYEETNNQNISTSFTPATEINLTKSDEKHHTTGANPDEAIPTIEKEKKKWGENIKKTTSKKDYKSDVVTSKYDLNGFQDIQNAENTSVVTLKKQTL